MKPMKLSSRNNFNAITALAARHRWDVKVFNEGRHIRLNDRVDVWPKQLKYNIYRTDIRGTLNAVYELISLVANADQMWREYSQKPWDFAKKQPQATLFDAEESKPADLSWGDSSEEIPW